MKKILSILLILAMALSFTVMAFAEEKKDDPEILKQQEETARRLQQQSEAFRSNRNGKRRR